MVGTLAMADWDALPEGLAALIASNLPVIEDFVAFRSTCSSWRKATTLNDFYTSSSSASSPCPKLPLLMEIHIDRVRVDLDGEDVQRQDDDDDGHKFGRLLRMVGHERKFLSLSRAKTCNLSFPDPKGFMIQPDSLRSVDLPYVLDLNYYNGKFYALTATSHVWMCDASAAPNPTINKIVELPWNWSRPHATLVECGGRLLIVAPYFCCHWDLDSLNDLEMVEIDVIKGTYNSITSLGSYAVFLGNNQGFSIDASRFSGIIEPNSIYFGHGRYQIATPGPKHKSEKKFGFGVWLNF